jgi:hypothetical protein
MRHDELYVADLVDSTRAVREYPDGISREQWDEDRVQGPLHDVVSWIAPDAARIDEPFTGRIVGDIAAVTLLRSRSR